jgi:hypothetical protein
MQTEANKSNWGDLFMQAYHRSGRSPKKLSEILSIPRKTICNWLWDMPKEPRNLDQIVENLEKFLKENPVSGKNPCAIARMWQTMRCMKKFTIGDLEAIANASRSHALQLVKALFKAGYLKCIKEEPAEYFLIRDTGPKAPTIKRTRSEIFDNNLNQAVAA